MVKPKASKPFTIDIPAKTEGQGSSTLGELHPRSQIVDAESAAIVEQSENQLPGKEIAAPAHLQVSNLSHSIAPAADRGVHPLKNQAETEIQSLCGIGDLVYVTYLEHQNPQLLGEVAEVTEVTTTEMKVVIKISLQPITG